MIIYGSSRRSPVLGAVLLHLSQRDDGGASCVSSSSLTKLFVSWLLPLNQLGSM